MKPLLPYCLAMAMLVNGIATPARAASGADWAAAILGAMIVMSDADEQARAKQQREQDLINQNELLKRYIAQRLAAEQLAKERAEAAERQQPRQAPATQVTTGSGFFISSPGYLLTNNHVIADGKYIYLRDRTGKFYSARVVARDKEIDLALLETKVKRQGLPIAKFSSVTKGQKIFAIGYPVPSIQGAESKITDGIISSFTGARSDDRRFQISAPVQPGNSGGPLVNDKGEVVGVVVSKIGERAYMENAGALPQNVNYAIRTDALTNFLESNKVGAAGGRLLGDDLNSADAHTVMVIVTTQPISLAVDTDISPEDTASDDFAKAKIINTCRAWDLYLSKYKTSKLAGAAEKARADAEQQAWDLAQRSSTIASYREFESTCPGGTRRNEVARQIAKLTAEEERDRAEFAEYAAAVKENTCTPVEDFVRKHPNGRYTGNATDQLRAIDDGKYRTATKLKSIEAWSDLITTCPNSRYAEEAKSNISRLNEVARSQRDETAWINKQSEAFKQGGYDDVISAALDKISRGKGTTVTFALAGISAVRLGKLMDADGYLSAGLSFAPGDQYITTGLGLVKAQLGQSKEAISLLTPLLGKKLQKADQIAVLEHLAVSHYRLNDDDKTKEYLSKLQGIDNDRYQRALKLFGYNSLNSALKLIGVKTNRISTDQWWLNLVADALVNNQFVRTKNLCETYSSQVPDSKFVLYLQSLAQYMDGQSREAQVLFNTAYRKEPSIVQGLGKAFSGVKHKQLLEAVATLLGNVDKSAANAFTTSYLSN